LPPDFPFDFLELFESHSLGAEDKLGIKLTVGDAVGLEVGTFVGLMVGFVVFLAFSTLVTVFVVVARATLEVMDANAPTSRINFMF